MVRRLHKKNATTITYLQIALVAINPHTGQILALVGGRNYGVSQLNHAIAERPTGSIFKPFVYAAAYNTSLNGMTLGDEGVFTALTKLDDDRGRSCSTASHMTITFEEANFQEWSQLQLRLHTR